MNFKEIKQICIIGNSGNLIGSNLGKKIDKQEIVVRFNAGLPEMHPNLKKDIGTRTDIYVNRQEFRKKFGLLNGKTKCFFSATSGRNKGFAEEKGVELFPLHCAEEGFNPGEEKRIFRETWNKMDYKGQKLTAGLGFIILCLWHNIPEINICGFTTNENYNPDEPIEFYHQDTYGERIKKEAPHDLKTEKRFISQLIKEKRINYLK